jgi:hypothetical protein
VVALDAAALDPAAAAVEVDQVEEDIAEANTNSSASTGDALVRTSRTWRTVLPLLVVNEFGSG